MVTDTTIIQSLSIYNSGRRTGAVSERIRITDQIDNLIHDTEDCPLYEGEERDWLLSAYWNVRRLVAADVRET